jgi:hypothetical protein
MPGVYNKKHRLFWECTMKMAVPAHSDAAENKKVSPNKLKGIEFVFLLIISKKHFLSVKKSLERY